MYFLHYPAGGFGHYMLSLISIGFENSFCPTSNIVFSKNGNSHLYPKHFKSWIHFSENFSLIKNFNFQNKIPVCLVDSGINQDSPDLIFKKFKGARIIRMCIDKNARSIVSQTCQEKAQSKPYNFYSSLDWEKREEFSLWYHYMDQNIDYYTNNFKPDDRCININISDLFLNFENIISSLENLFGKRNLDLINKLHNEFLLKNKKYFLAEKTWLDIDYALDNNIDFELKENYSLHDQGYINYQLEKKFNLIEIPPYSYREWFKNTQEIRHCLKSIHSQ